MICKKCGTEMDATAKFCPECGTAQFKAALQYQEESPADQVTPSYMVSSAPSSADTQVSDTQTKGSKKSLFIIPAIAVILLALIGGITLFKKPATPQADPISAEATDDVAEEVSEPEPEILMPDVIGLKEEAGISKLTDLGLFVICVYKHTFHHDPGTIFMQSIEKGTAVEPESEITITIATADYPGGRPKEEVLKLYDRVLKPYRRLMETPIFDDENTGIANLAVFFPEIGYALTDLNEDGSDELFIISTEENPESSAYGFVFALYTLRGNETECLYYNKSMASSMYLCENNVIRRNYVSYVGLYQKTDFLKYTGRDGFEQVEGVINDNSTVITVDGITDYPSRFGWNWFSSEDITRDEIHPYWDFDEDTPTTKEEWESALKKHPMITQDEVDSIFDSYKIISPAVEEVISNSAITTPSVRIDKMKGEPVDIGSLPASLGIFLYDFISYRPLSYNSEKPAEILKKKPHILSYVLDQFSCVDYHICPYDISNEIYEDIDPLKIYDPEKYINDEVEYSQMAGYRKLNAQGIDWIMKNVFNCSDAYLEQMRQTAPASHHFDTQYPSFYYHDGYYYCVEEMGFGGPWPDVNIISATYDGKYYYVLYHQGYYYSGDAYEISMRYAKLELREKDGLKFCSLIEYEFLNQDGGLEIAPRVKLTGDHVNMRREPSVEADIFRRARKSDEFFYLDTEKGDDGKDWYKVGTWFSGEFYVRSDLAELFTP